MRLKQKLVPIMWNFTVRAARKPSLKGIEELWNNEGARTTPLRKIDDITVNDIFLGEYKKYSK